jgi:SnoaL-like domain
VNTSEIELRRLLDTEAIRRVLLRYATAIDTWNIELFSECFTEDVHAIYNYNDLNGLAELKQYFVDLRFRGPLGANALTTRTHFTGNVNIELDGDQASSETYLLALNTTDDGRLLFRCNRYFDQFIRYEQRWLINDRRHVTDWMTEATVRLDPDNPAKRA